MEAHETVCPDCAEAIKKAAKVCKHCGYRFDIKTILKLDGGLTSATGTTSDQQTPSFWHTLYQRSGLIAASLVILFVIGRSVGVFTLPDDNVPASAKVVDEKEAANLAFLKEAEDAVRRQLRDPSSAQFSNVYIYPKFDAACGSVNAKNGLGGYTGEDHFAYHKHQVAFASIDVDKFIKLSDKCNKAIQSRLESNDFSERSLPYNSTY